MNHSGYVDFPAGMCEINPARAPLQRFSLRFFQAPSQQDV